MPRLRVLVVDDAVVVRRLISTVLSEDPEIEVVGVAPNGRIALTKLPQVSPDVVILDVEMPELDGLATLKEIRKWDRRLPVLMFSTRTQRGAEATLDALSLGASDYVTKPAQAGSAAEALQTVRETLIPKVKQFHEKASAGAAPTVRRVSPRAATAHAGIDLVAIGTSTGGPDALNRLLPLLPADFSVPVVVVQHMPPRFTRLLAERLDGRCALRVREATEGERLVPGTIWIAPGDFHLTVSRDEGRVHTRLSLGPAENACRPAVDVLLRSVVETYGGRALGVILTGMGQDGHRGCALLREAGGQVLAQDEATSVVWGMPGIVVHSGLANQVLPLEEIGPEIVRRVRQCVPRECQS